MSPVVKAIVQLRIIWKFCELSSQAGCNDVTLMDIFQHGINDMLNYLMSESDVLGMPTECMVAVQFITDCGNCREGALQFNDTLQSLSVSWPTQTAMKDIHDSLVTGTETMQKLHTLHVISTEVFTLL